MVKRGDVLMAVDEEVIADNGTVRISDVSIGNSMVCSDILA